MNIEEKVVIAKYAAALIERMILSTGAGSFCRAAS